MKETLEEFGSVLICCVIGFIAILFLGYLTAKTGLLARFASLYSDFFYGN